VTEAEKSPAENAAVVDGRRRRGHDNRARIVAAMLAIIGEGEVSPSAEQVAARADVGLRTVFRHFLDMDSLYREMSGVIEAELRSVADRPLRTQSWPDRLFELIERRAIGFEKIAPFKHASDALRHRSKFLEADSARLAAGLLEILQREVPPAIAADPVTLGILELLLSFEAWSRLRREQGLSPEQAQEILSAAARRVIG
jgi:AcrR family transcriptional regulator